MINVKVPLGVNVLDEIRVTGGKPLRGRVSVQGSKNAALPMMAASLLHRGVSVLRGCPKIADVYCMEEILEGLGAVTWWEGRDLYLDCAKADRTVISEENTGKMRSSVILLGAMLGRNGKGFMGYPGGCVIGKRPIDLHIYALKKLGASVTDQRPAESLQERKFLLQRAAWGLRSREFWGLCWRRGKPFYRTAPVSLRLSGCAAI